MTKEELKKKYNDLLLKSEDIESQRIHIGNQWASTQVRLKDLECEKQVLEHDKAVLDMALSVICEMWESINRGVS